MPATLSADLKRAVTHLPDKEKNKLLLRLLAKDAILAEKLEYELVEEKSTLDQRRQLIRDLIDRTVRLSQDSAGLMMMDMRTISGYITRHVKVTKDTYGEVDLTLYMLSQFAQQHGDLLHRLNGRTEKCALYVEQGTDSIQKKLLKLNADYFLEFDEPMNGVLRYVFQHAPAHYARQLGTPTNWRWDS